MFQSSTFAKDARILDSLSNLQIDYEEYAVSDIYLSMSKTELLNLAFEDGFYLVDSSENNLTVS